MSGAHWWNGTAATLKRSEEHTSELQSQSNLVCRLLLEKKNNDHVLPQSLHVRSTPTDEFADLFERFVEVDSYHSDPVGAFNRCHSRPTCSSVHRVHVLV